MKKKQDNSGCCLVVIIFIFATYYLTKIFNDYIVLAILILVPLGIYVFLFLKSGARLNQATTSWLSSRKHIGNIHDLSPRELEEFVSELYSRLGYQTVLTKQVGDDGIDVIANMGNSKYAIQVKQTNHPTGSPVMQKLYGSMGHIMADGGICVSTGGFTTEARRFVENKNIELIDAKDLLKLVEIALSENDNTTTQYGNENNIEPKHPAIKTCKGKNSQATTREKNKLQKNGITIHN